MFYLILVLLLVGVFLVAKVFPIISGYRAKNICSNIFLCNRSIEDVIKNELGTFPLNLGSYTVDLEEKFVTGSVLGLAKKKAVYRKGLGATLVNGIDSKVLPAQKFDIPTTLKTNNDIFESAKLNQPKKAEIANINQKQLGIALAEAFSESVKSKRGTRAVLVVYDGEIIAERYAEGFTANTKFAGWSMAKSITNALIGILVKQGTLDVNSPAPIADWQNDSRRDITIAHLLQMSSGLRWWEYYRAPSDATNMLYNEKSMGEFAAAKKLKHKPGERFSYSSGSTNILSTIIRNAIDEKDYYHFPYKELFYKIGMFDTVLEVDAGGTFVGSSYCFATARNWARLGLLYLNDGIWNGERVLPEGWVDFTTTPTTAELLNVDGGYGAQFWLNRAANGGKLKYPDVPADCFACQGYEGQYIWIIPSKKLVVVRLALEKGDELDPNTFLPPLIKSLP